MKEIALTQGRVALVNDEWCEYLNQWKWAFHSNGYAYRTVYENGKRIGTVFMHRVIMNVPNGVRIDHRNGNRLDNRTENLRVANPQENNRNSEKPKGQWSSIYKGVSWHKGGGRWVATITVDYKQIYLGLFDTEHAAAMAYDLWAHDLFGEFAKTNFQRAA